MPMLFSCFKPADTSDMVYDFRHRSSAKTMEAPPRPAQMSNAGWKRRWKGFKKAFRNLFSCFLGAEYDLQHYTDVQLHNNSTQADDFDKDLEVADCGAGAPKVDVTQNQDSATSARSSEESTEITDINSCWYEVGKKIGEGGCGSVYEGIRSTDGLKVALKFADKDELEYINIDGYSEAIPDEIALHILATKGPKVPQIIELLDWEEKTDYYVMVLERPMPCQDLVAFHEEHYKDATIEEELAAVIMQQATLAAQTCCQRGVLHRDIKPENLLINSETHEVKLIDFGCGELLTSSPYTSYRGTKYYWPPEFDTTGQYNGMPATVWSLGIVLFLMVADRFPESEDLDKLNNNIWSKDGLSPECCELLCSLLQRDPEKRLELEKILLHDWFKCLSSQQEEPEITGGTEFTFGVPTAEELGRSEVDKTEVDSLQVMPKFNVDTEIAEETDDFDKDLEVAECGADALDTSVHSTPDCKVDVTQNRLSATSARSSKKSTENTKINSYWYEVGKKIGEGGCGSVFEGIRWTDGLKVALKFADKDQIKYINIDGYSEAIPDEIALHILATKGPKVPQIIELLDWEEKTDYYVMVLERPMPCQDLIDFYKEHYKDTTIEEELAAVIMQQATLAAQTCCQRGVLHRDIKPENLLINPETHEVKLIDFGCGELLKSSPYTSYSGTEAYWPPEFDTTGEYNGMPATVWSLGIILFLMVAERFPESEDLDNLNNNIWSKDGSSPECCELLCSLLQRDPEKRLELEKILLHDWFKCLSSQQEEPEITGGTEFTFGVPTAEELGRSEVDKTEVDSLQVMPKFNVDTEIAEETDDFDKDLEVAECGADALDTSVHSTPDCKVDVTQNRLSATSARSSKKSTENTKINSCWYEVGKKIGEGGCGSVYEGIRWTDGLKVALKFADKDQIKYINIDGYSEAIPDEIALHILATKGPKVPQIIELLDWEEKTDYYVMVLERPMPCQDLIDFYKEHYKDATIEEELAAVIMQQATLAAQTCCQRGVLHRDIKPENLLINPETHKVKLIDFGCGELLKSSPYTSYSGTEAYGPPEFDTTGEYNGMPATVWSLGIILFLMVAERFPESEDLDNLNNNIWSKDGSSPECCELLCSLLQRDPEKRLELEKILLHDWFKCLSSQQEEPEITGGTEFTFGVHTAEELGRSEVDKTEVDSLQVMPKFNVDTEIAEETDDFDKDLEVAECGADALDTSVHSTPDCKVDVTQNRLSATSARSSKKSTENTKINSCWYEVGKKIGEGGCGSVYEGIRWTDGLKVALKFADKDQIKYINIDGYSEAIPVEIALHILATKGPKVPQIIELLDWEEKTDYYVMVLERPMPCQDLVDFYKEHYKDATIEEELAAVIMQQATLAAQTCCQRGVLHRDIKPENLLINPETHEVKLIDFGCGELLKSSPYTSYSGTEAYGPPEFDTTGEYNGMPATVWSLGIILFLMVAERFPESEDLDNLNNNIWSKDGSSPECCELLCSLLQRDPEKRLELEKILLHDWFKCLSSQQEEPEITEINSYWYEVGKKIGEGGCGSVYEGIRWTDGLKVALKFADKDQIKYINIDGYSEAIPDEIALHILATKGPKVPQIIELLDWEEKTDYYVMVLERPMPCQDLVDFYKEHYKDATIEEELAAVIMQQATLAAQTCCQRGVLHRDIKPENLLINPETHEVKLIDFGCGELLKSSPYTSYSGTEAYGPPEFDTTGEYNGMPATVWSLGIILFLMVAERFPESEDLDNLNNNIWSKDGSSPECCELLCSLLQRDPEKRLELEKILLHDWFKCLSSQQEEPEITGGTEFTFGVPTAEELGRSEVDKTEVDSLQVMPKFNVDTEIAEETDDFDKDLEVAECGADAFDTSVHSTPDCKVDVTQNRLSATSARSSEKSTENTKINSCWYEVGKKIGEGGCGSVYEGIRWTDGLKVALKFADKDQIKYINIDGYSEAIPVEIALHILATKGPKVPQIIELLDWEEKTDYYVMVLERPMPCQDLVDFYKEHYKDATIEEELAAVIMQQATLAAQTCCQRGVLHRDIKPENLLINPETHKVKLIDFGCSDLLKSSPYTSYSGTEAYGPPEFDTTGEYNGMPATVWSLGIILFLMVAERFPESEDMDNLNNNIWSKDGSSPECCELLCSLLQRDPEKRLELEKILLHDWFKCLSSQQEEPEITGGTEFTFGVPTAEELGRSEVDKTEVDSLQVMPKFNVDNEIAEETDDLDKDLEVAECGADALDTSVHSTPDCKVDVTRNRHCNISQIVRVIS